MNLQQLHDRGLLVGGPCRSDQVHHQAPVTNTSQQSSEQKRQTGNHDSYTHNPLPKPIIIISDDDDDDVSIVSKPIGIRISNDVLYT